MPLKINSLKVSISVNQTKSEGGEGSSTPVTELDAGKKADPDKIVQNVLEQVMRIMSDKKER